jgi:hypothetical protein
MHSPERGALGNTHLAEPMKKIIYEPERAGYQQPPRLYVYLLLDSPSREVLTKNHHAGIQLAVEASRTSHLVSCRAPRLLRACVVMIIRIQRASMSMMNPPIAAVRGIRPTSSRASASNHWVTRVMV